MKRLKFLFVAFCFWACHKDETTGLINITITAKDVYSKQTLSGIPVNLYYCSSTILSADKCDSVNAGTTGSNGLFVFLKENKNRYNETPPVFRHYSVAAMSNDNYAGSVITKLNDENAAELLVYPFVYKRLRLSSTSGYDSLRLEVTSDHNFYFTHSKADTYNLKCIPGISNNLRLQLFKAHQPLKDTGFSFTPTLHDTTSILLKF